MHEDYQADSRPVYLGLGSIRVNVLSPVDLAVSKIARLTDNDREAIRELVLLGLTDADEIEDRATEALSGYVGGIEMLKANLRDAISIAREAETHRAKNDPADGGRYGPSDAV